MIDAAPTCQRNGMSRKSRARCIMDNAAQSVSCFRSLVATTLLPRPSRGRFSAPREKASVASTVESVRMPCEATLCLSCSILLWSLLFLLLLLLLSPAAHAAAATAAPTLVFDGAQYAKITLPEVSESEVEDISLRFQTLQPDGLLFATSSAASDDGLLLVLKDGQVQLTVALGTASKTLVQGQGLDDELWHTVKVKRRAQQVELRVDNSTVTKGRVKGGTKAMQLGEIEVGKRSTRRHSKRDIDVDDQGDDDDEDDEDDENFVGKMQQFVFNNVDFFRMARTGAVQNVETSARFENRDKLVKHPVTFKSTAAYLTTKLKVYGTFSIYFQIKTTQPDGLIMYSGGKDFLVIELVNGHLRYTFDVGSGPRVVKANLRRPINDNKWHSVSILRPVLSQHILRVDDAARFDNLPDTRQVHFDSDDDFYVGGITKQMFNALPSQVKSREGFQGCLGSVDLDGDSRDIMMQHRSSIPEEYQDTIVHGCEGPTTECLPTSCDNQGVCIQEWNSYTCDCDMTSFTGPTCTEDGMAYTFGSGGGLVTYTFPDGAHRDTKRDTLALGFITTQKDAVLVRINSGDTNDYIEMEVVDGNIFVVYNMGTLDHPIGELFEKVNDGNYHVVRFIRNGPNSTIQVDDIPVQSKHPTGKQLSVFNNQNNLYIGGRKDAEGEIDRPFIGTIAGLVLNGVPVLSKAAEGDSKVNIEGDVDLEIKPLRQHYGLTAPPPTRPVIVTPAPGDTSTTSMQSTMGVKTTPRGDGATDDIIYSGAGSGCHYEDEDDCAHTGTGPKDALIRPVVTIKSTPRPPTTSPSEIAPVTTLEPRPIPSEASGEGPCEDDEDCAESSGSGFVVDPAQTAKTSTDDIIYIKEKDEGEDTGPTKDRPKHPLKTTTDPILFQVNMTTEAPPRKPNPGATTHKGGGGGGGGEGTPPSTGNTGSGTGPGGSATGGGGKDGAEVGQEETPDRGTSLGMNIGLIVGIAAGVVLLLLILAYAFYKYRSRDEGSYKIDESKNYSYETCNTKPPSQVNGGVNKSGNCSKPKKKDVKEWYV